MAIANRSKQCASHRISQRISQRSCRRIGQRAYQRPQDGFVLFMVLVILVAMTLLGVGLTRVTDTAIQVANNISFKQSTVVSADSGIEQAIATLQTQVTDKLQDSPENGYYATDKTGTDFTGTSTPDDSTDDVDWSGTPEAANRARVGARAGGNAVSYIIHRLCLKNGGLTTAADGTANSCATTSANSTSGGSKGGAAYGQYAISGKPQIYYRITVRTEGARNTVSYVQSMVLAEY